MDIFRLKLMTYLFGLVMTIPCTVFSLHLSLLDNVKGIEKFNFIADRYQNTDDLEMKGRNCCCRRRCRRGPTGPTGPAGTLTSAFISVFNNTTATLVDGDIISWNGPTPSNGNGISLVGGNALQINSPGTGIYLVTFGVEGIPSTSASVPPGTLKNTSSLFVIKINGTTLSSLIDPGLDYPNLRIQAAFDIQIFGAVINQNGMFSHSQILTLSQNDLVQIAYANEVENTQFILGSQTTTVNGNAIGAYATIIRLQ